MESQVLADDVFLFRLKNDPLLPAPTVLKKPLLLLKLLLDPSFPLKGQFMKTQLLLNQLPQPIVPGDILLAGILKMKIGLEKTSLNLSSMRH